MDSQPQTQQKETKTKVLSNKLKERVLDNIEESIKMPECAEKTLVLIIYTLAKIIDSSFSCSNHQIDDVTFKLEDLFTTLQEQLAAEEQDTIEIMQHFKEAISLNEMLQSKASFDKFFQILKLIRLIDIALIVKLTQMALQTKKIIQGKDIILIIGGTGVGKSTTIHYLAGSVMQEEITAEGLFHICPQVVKNPALSNVKCSPYNESETRFITSVSVSEKEFENGYDDNIYILVDTPGFEDTAGPEVDIANSIGLVESTKESNSVKPIVLISYKSIGDRGQGIKDLAKIVIRMINELANDIDISLRSFNFFFTKYPEKEKATIYASLKNIYDTLTPNEMNEGFPQFFKTIMNKTNNPKKNLKPIIVNPLDDDPLSLLKEIDDFNAIEDPKEFFKFCVSEKSYSILNQQLQKHELAIINAINRHDYGMIQYKLSQLQLLNEKMNEKNVKACYQNCLTKFCNQTNNYYNQSIKQFQTSLNQDIIIQHDNIDIFCKCWNHAKLIQSYNIDSNDQLIDADKFLTVLEQYQDIAKNQSTELELNDKKLNIIVKNLQLLVEKELQGTINGLKQVISNITVKIQKQILKCIELIKNKSYEKFLKLYIQLQGIKEIYDANIKNTNLEDNLIFAIQQDNVAVSEEILHYPLDFLMTRLEEEFQAVQKILNQPFERIIDLSPIEQIKVNMVKVLQILKFLPNNDMQNLIKIHEKVDHALSTKFSMISQNINDILKDPRCDNLSRVQKLLINLQSLYQIPHVAISQVENYYKTIQYITIWLSKKEDSVKEAVNNLNLNQNTESQELFQDQFEKIEDSINFMVQSKWIKDLIQNDYDEILGNIETLIYKFVRRLKVAVNKINISLQNYKDLYKLHQIYEQIESIQNKFCGQMKTLETNVIEIQEKIKQIMDDVFKQIAKIYLTQEDKKQIQKEENVSEHNLIQTQLLHDNKLVKTSLYDYLNFKDIKCSIDFLQKCLEIHFYEQTCKYMYDKLVYFLKKCGQETRQETQRCITYFNNQSEKNQDNSEKKEEITMHLFRYLDMLSELDSYEIIKQLFNDNTNLYKLALTQLIEIQRSLDEQKLTDNVNELRQILSLAKHLSQLDNFFPNDKDKFYPIYKEVFQLLQLTDKNIIVLIDNYTKEGQFENVMELFEQINTQDPKYTKAQKCIENNLKISHVLIAKKLIKKIQDVKSINQQQIELLVEQLNIIISADNYLGQILLDKNILKSVLTNANEIIIQCIIQSSILVENYFYELEFNSGHDIISRFQDSFTAYINELKIEIVKESIGEDKVYYINDVKKVYDIYYKEIEKKVLDKVVEKYNSLPLKDYTYYPPKVCIENLFKTPIQLYRDKALLLKSKIYEHLSSIIKEHKKVVEEMQIPILKSNKDHQFYSDNNNNEFKDQVDKIAKMLLQSQKQMDQIQNVLSYLPEDTKKILNKEIQELGFDKQNNLINEAQQVEQFIETKSIEQLSQYWQKYRFDKQRLAIGILNRIEEYITATVLIQFNAIIDYLQSGKVEDNKIKMNISFISQAKKIFPIIIERLNTKFFKSLIALFEQSTESIIYEIKEDQDEYSDNECAKDPLVDLSFDISSIYSNSNKKDIRASLNIILRFVKLWQLLQDQTINPHHKNLLLEEAMPQFIQKLKKFIEYIDNCYITYEKKFGKGLETLKVDILNDCIEKSSIWEVIIKKVKKHSKEINIIVFQEEGISHIKIDTIKIQISKHIFQKIQEAVQNEVEQFNKLLEQDFMELRSDKECQDYYEKLKTQYEPINSVSQLNLDKVSVFQDKIQFINQCLKRKAQDIIESCDNIINSKTNTQQKYSDINVIHLNMKYMPVVGNQQFLKSIEYEKLKSKILNNFDELLNQAQDNIDINEIANCLIAIQMIRENITLDKFVQYTHNKIEDVLTEFKKKQGQYGYKQIEKLATLLQKEVIAGPLLTEFSVFKGHSISEINKKIQGYTFQEVINKMKTEIPINNDITSDSEKLLEEYYIRHQKKYDELLDRYLVPNMKLEGLLIEIQQLVSKVTKKFNKNEVELNDEVKKQIPELSAHIFALWTLQNATYYFETEDNDNKHNFLIKPHTVQTLSILKIFSVDKKPKEQDKGYFWQNKKVSNCSNSLVQIGTGEGKSIILAVTASILALLGFEVSCACYSKYLSERDEQQFQKLYDVLQISEYIIYGTFNKICERQINKDVDMRDQIQSLFNKDSLDIKKLKINSTRPSVLLIDEVDVFFSKDFYGNVYTPSATLEGTEISSLIDFIWNQKDCSSNFYTLVIESDHFKNILKRYPQWRKQFIEIVKQMIFDLKTFQEPKYIIHQDKIGYKDQDNIETNIKFGYKTLFAYYYENHRFNISLASLNKNKTVSLNCGSFSYAQIPEYFLYKMGVTGTLSTLSKEEQQVLQQEYNFATFSYMPSVYGSHKRTFKLGTDILIVSNIDYFTAIVEQINYRIAGRTSGTERAVLVFFQDRGRLDQFYKSSQFQQLKPKSQKITEENTIQEKDQRIRRATVSGQISLITRALGRGTDFIIQDETVKNNAGIHCLQTFFSDEKSEEVQIMGRIARQGEEGSYSMVLLDIDLEKYSSDTLNKLNLTYQQLDEKRKDFSKVEYLNNQEYVKQANENHKNSQKMMNYIRNNQIDEVRSLILQYNKGPQINSKSRTIVLMDATGSMSSLLTQTKNTVQVMFEQAQKILTDEGLEQNCFQLLFAVYRNYSNVEQDILESSGWQSSADCLRDFMQKTNAKGGLGPNEAVEVGLYFANQEHKKDKITQVILIADAGAHEENEAADYRKYYPSRITDYWSQTRYKDVTYYKPEIEQMKKQKIKVHTFYLSEHAEKSFKLIATTTGGICSKLDIQSSDSPKILTKLVTTEILKDVGNSIGDGRGEQLAERYARTYA